MTLDEVVALSGGRLGRSAAYQAAREFLQTNGARGIPCIRVGRRILCPTAGIRRWAMVDADPPLASVTRMRSLIDSSEAAVDV